MIKLVLTVLLLALLAWGGWHFWNFTNRKMTEVKTEESSDTAPAPGKLPGMPASMESSLDTARRAGADGLARWLNEHRAQLRDPRLAEIELDYVVLIGPTRPTEARRVLNGLRARLKSTSPVYKRFEQLDKAYP